MADRMHDKVTLITGAAKGILEKAGLKLQRMFKLQEGRPNALDFLKNREIQLVINTPVGKMGQSDDDYIRKNAIKYKVPYITTLAAAMAAAEGIAVVRKGRTKVKSLQEYHRDIV